MESAENKDTGPEDVNKMASICAEVENMIKEGKGVEECVQRKETLKNILAILDPKNEGGENIENKEIHKIDEPKQVMLWILNQQKKLLNLKL